MLLLLSLIFANCSLTVAILQFISRWTLSHFWIQSASLPLSATLEGQIYRPLGIFVWGKGWQCQKFPLIISRINQLSLLKSLPYSWNIKISMIDCTQNSVLQGKEYIAVYHQVKSIFFNNFALFHLNFLLLYIRGATSYSTFPAPPGCLQYSAKPLIPSLHFFCSISIKISINFIIGALSSSSWLPAILHQPSWNFWELQLWSPVNKPLPCQYQVLNNIYLAIITIF